MTNTINDHVQENYKQIIIDSIKNGTRTARIAKELGLTKSYVDQIYFEYLRQPVDVEQLAETKFPALFENQTPNKPDDLTSI